MKITPLFIFLLLVKAVSFGQITIDTTAIIIYDSTTKSYNDWSMYIGQMDSSEQVTLLTDTISQSDFTKFKQNYQNKIDLDSSIVSWTDSSFSIKSKKTKIIYNTIVTDDYPYNYYLGFLTPLNLYLVSSIDGRSESGSLLYIDSKTGKSFFSASPYDYPCEVPLISPKNKYLVSFANNWAEHNVCFLSILKIEQGKKYFKLKGIFSSEFDQWTISEIVWIDDISFAMAVKENIDPSNYDRYSGVDHYIMVTMTR